MSQRKIPGRPEIGQPINVRLGDELLTQVDNYAARQSISRAQAIRQAVRALVELDDDTITEH